MTDPAVVEMEKAGDIYFASRAAYRKRKLREKTMDWIVNPMPVLRLTYQPAVVQPREIPRAVLTEKLLTKSAQVRAKIADAKKKHQSHSTVVEWAVTTLSMNKGQANRYVEENWKRS